MLLLISTAITLPRSLRINNFHSRSPATNRATAKSPPAEAAGPQAWHRRGGDPPPEERNHCARQQQSLSHSPPRRARPVGGNGDGPVLLHSRTAADGRGPELGSRTGFVDRDAELHRLLHRQPRRRPRLGRTQPDRLPTPPPRLPSGTGRGGPDPRS